MQWDYIDQKFLERLKLCRRWLMTCIYIYGYNRYILLYNVVVLYICPRNWYELHIVHTLMICTAACTCMYIIYIKYRAVYVTNHGEIIFRNNLFVACVSSHSIITPSRIHEKCKEKLAGSINGPIVCSLVYLSEYITLIWIVWLNININHRNSIIYNILIRKCYRTYVLNCENWSTDLDTEKK